MLRFHEFMNGKQRKDIKFEIKIPEKKKRYPEQNVEKVAEEVVFFTLAVNLFFFFPIFISFSFYVFKSGKIRPNRNSVFFFLCVIVTMCVLVMYTIFSIVFFFQFNKKKKNNQKMIPNTRFERA